jgi:hypothetical protein
MASQKITTVLVAHPTKPDQTMYVNSNDPGLGDGTYKIIEEKKIVESTSEINNTSSSVDDEYDDEDDE